MSRPVVLIHGLLSTEHAMYLLGWRLKRRGHDVHFTDLSFLCVQDVNLLSRQLEATVGRVLAETGATEVDLVGLSQGGLIALAYLRWLGGTAFVRKAIFVAAPFRGTPAARVGALLFGACTDGVWQILPDSDFVLELTAALPTDVELATVAIDRDPVAAPEACRLKGVEHHVLDGPVGPLNHQWIGFGMPLVRTLDRLLTDAES